MLAHLVKVALDGACDIVLVELQKLVHGLRMDHRVAGARVEKDACLRHVGGGVDVLGRGKAIRL
jgi:hypothetical protein